VRDTSHQDTKSQAEKKDFLNDRFLAIILRSRMTCNNEGIVAKNLKKGLLRGKDRFPLKDCSQELQGRGDRSDERNPCYQATPEGKPLVSPWGVSAPATKQSLKLKISTRKFTK